MSKIQFLKKNFSQKFLSFGSARGMLMKKAESCDFEGLCRMIYWSQTHDVGI